MIEYDNLHPVLIDVAARRPQKDSRQPRPKKKKRRKMRLSLRQSKIKKADSYTDSIGWSQSQTGRVLEDVDKPKEPETLMIQCEMCGCRLKIQTKETEILVSCSYPEGHYEIRLRIKYAQALYGALISILKNKI